MASLPQGHTQASRLRRRPLPTPRVPDQRYAAQPAQFRVVHLLQGYARVWWQTQDGSRSRRPARIPSHGRYPHAWANDRSELPRIFKREKGLSIGCLARTAEVQIYHAAAFRNLSEVVIRPVFSKFPPLPIACIQNRARYPTCCARQNALSQHKWENHRKTC